jgi:hypothetical protein
MSIAEWVLIGSAAVLWTLGIARAIYVAGIHKGIDLERGRVTRLSASLKAREWDD